MSDCNNVWFFVGSIVSEVPESVSDAEGNVVSTNFPLQLL